MSYLMYPTVFTKFAKARQAWGDIEVLPTPQFFFGMEKGEEITVELEPGKTLFIRLLTVGDPHPDGFRTVFFELNGQPREVEIRDKSLKAAASARVESRPRQAGRSGRAHSGRDHDPARQIRTAHPEGRAIARDGGDENAVDGVRSGDWRGQESVRVST